MVIYIGSWDSFRCWEYIPRCYGLFDDLPGKVRPLSQLMQVNQKEGLDNLGIPEEPDIDFKKLDKIMSMTAMSYPIGVLWLNDCLDAKKIEPFLKKNNISEVSL